MKSLLFLGLLVAGCAPTVATQSAERDMVEGVNFAPEPGKPSIEETYPQTSGMPRDVQAYIIRWSDCTHWQGEYSEYPDRQRQIRRSVRQACAGVDNLGRRVRARHAGNAAIIERLRDLEPVDDR